jgi:small subunit ribosomal protein S18
MSDSMMPGSGFGYGGGYGGGMGFGGGARGLRKRGCEYCGEGAPTIDYKDPQSLRYFITDRGKIVPRRTSGLCAKHQREMTTAIKQARNIALLPFSINE